MQADPADQERLLDLAACDTALTQIAHRRRTLPELAEVERLDGVLRGLSDDRVRAQVTVDDLDRDIARLERDVDQVRQRAARDKQRLESGQGSAKELEGLQHELASLGRRQGELEDGELELMEQRETAQSGLQEVENKVEEVRAERDGVEERKDAALAELTADEQRRTQERGTLAGGVPADLLALYERIRGNTGMGAAMLRARRCEGCRIELSGSALAEVRNAAPDDVVRCEECGRILVRTKESGL